MTDNNKMYHMVKDFQKAFGHPWSDKPRMLTEEEVAGRYKWTLEELNELVAAKTVYDQADALVDALYFILGGFAMMGIEPYNLFEIVHSANMSKLWDDGKPRYKEDGKVKKPDGWVAPEPLLQKEIERQLNKVDVITTPMDVEPIEFEGSYGNDSILWGDINPQSQLLFEKKGDN